MFQRQCRLRLLQVKMGVITTQELDRLDQRDSFIFSSSPDLVTLGLQTKLR